MPRRWLRLTDLSKPKLTREASTSMEDISFNVSNAPGAVIRPKSMCVPDTHGADQNHYLTRSAFKDYHRYESINTEQKSDSLKNTCDREIKPDNDVRRVSLVRNDGKGRRPRSRRNPVQRAASRLYRAGNEPTSGVMGVRDCVGPEFVVRAVLPNKQLIIPDIKGSVRKIVTVIMLNGQKLDVVCNPNSTTAGQLFEVIYL